MKVKVCHIPKQEQHQTTKMPPVPQCMGLWHRMKTMHSYGYGMCLAPKEHPCIAHTHTHWSLLGQWPMSRPNFKSLRNAFFCVKCFAKINSFFAIVCLFAKDWIDKSKDIDCFVIVLTFANLDGGLENDVSSWSVVVIPSGFLLCLDLGMADEGSQVIDGVTFQEATKALLALIQQLGSCSSGSLRTLLSTEQKQERERWGHVKEHLGQEAGVGGSA